MRTQTANEMAPDDRADLFSMLPPGVVSTHTTGTLTTRDLLPEVSIKSVPPTVKVNPTKVTNSFHSPEPLPPKPLYL
jgi:hypothetical protein